MCATRQESLSTCLSRSFSDYQKGMRTKQLPVRSHPSFANPLKFQYTITFTFGAVRALDAIERFKDLVQKNFPEAYLEGISFASNGCTFTDYTLEYIVDRDNCKGLCPFLERTKKLFHPHGTVLIAYF